MPRQQLSLQMGINQGNGAHCGAWKWALAASEFYKRQVIASRRPLIGCFTTRRQAFSLLRVRLVPTVGALVAMLVLGGCATKEKEVQAVAKDWCMTIRGSQVIPVYPLTEDIQPGDVFLVQVPIDRQQELYKKKGFLALDNLITRLDPEHYTTFYGRSFFPTNGAYTLPRDWIRPDGAGIHRGTNGTNTLSWQAAPRAAFPSYSFTVRNGAGLNLAVPVQGIPVGLSLLASDAASGSVQIQDARTMGIDTISLYHQLQDWVRTNADFVRYFAANPVHQRTNFLRVVTRVYASGRMVVTLKDASNRSGGLDAGVPKPVNLLLPELPRDSTNTAEAALKNYTNAWSVISQLVAAATSAKDAAGNILPGGSVRLAAASARTVSLDEIFDPPLVVGYLGFDCMIDDDGGLGPPIPTQANLNPKTAGNVVQFRAEFESQTNYFRRIQSAYRAASAEKKARIRQRAEALGLVPSGVEDQKLIDALRRSVDANDFEIAKRLRELAEFSAATP